MQYMQSYVTMMENQTNKKLKIFQSDQGGEFKSHEFNNYLQNKGIVRQQSAPHIHQQNGRAERLYWKKQKLCEPTHHYQNLGGSLQ